MSSMRVFVAKVSTIQPHTYAAATQIPAGMLGNAHESAAVPPKVKTRLI